MWCLYFFFLHVDCHIGRVTRSNSTDGVDDEIRTLNAGEYFGEQALLKEDKRTANIIALPPSVTVLALDRT